jgi:hypothetical protein
VAPFSKLVLTLPFAGAAIVASRLSPFPSRILQPALPAKSAVFVQHCVVFTSAFLQNAWDDCVQEFKRIGDKEYFSSLVKIVSFRFHAHISIAGTSKYQQARSAS